MINRLMQGKHGQIVLSKTARHRKLHVVSEYDQEMPQSQTAKKPWHCEEMPHSYNETPGRQTKQRNQLSLPHRDDCKVRMDTTYRTTKHRTITESHNGSNNQERINNNRMWERSVSVVEYLTRDRGAAGLSLTGVTALWSLSKKHLS